MALPARVGGVAVAGDEGGGGKGGVVNLRGREFLEGKEIELDIEPEYKVYMLAHFCDPGRPDSMHGRPIQNPVYSD